MKEQEEKLGGNKMPDEEGFPTFEEFQEQMNKVDRHYRVDNVTFCSDASRYPIL